MRKLNWIIPAVVAAALVGIFVVWQWPRDRVDAGEVEALIAEIDKLSDEIDKALAEPPRADLDALARDLERFAAINKKAVELPPRIRQA